MLLNGITFLLVSYLVAVKNSRSIACTMLILPQYESFVLLIAAFLELVKILQCEQYFGRYRFESSTNNNMKYKFK